MRQLIFAVAIALIGLGIADQAVAQKGKGGNNRGDNRGWSGDNRGGWGYRGYGYGGYGHPWFLYFGFPGYGYGYSSNYPYDYAMPPDYNVQPGPDNAPPKLASDESVILVLVPDPQAEVLFDGQRTSQTGRERIFTPPKLTPGSTYSYTLTATFNRDGRQVRDERTIQVVPGRPTFVDFTKPPQAEKLSPPSKTLPKN